MSAREYRARYPDRWIPIVGSRREQAEAFGRWRFQESIKKGRSDRMGVNSVESHVLGAIGEFGCATYTGYRESTKVREFGKPDLGTDIGVRTRSKWYYELPIVEEDKGVFRYLLATWLDPYLVIRGYLRGDVVKAHEGWKRSHGYRPSWFVPHESLRNPEDLRRGVGQ